MIAVTSLAPDDTSRAALESWRDAGLKVVAVQAKEELPTIKEIYGDLVDEWVSVRQDGRQLYGRPYVFIWQMADLSIKWQQPIMIINSDIEIYGDTHPLVEMFAAGNTLEIGVRRNYVDRSHSLLEKYGLDAFVFGPEFASTLPKLSLCMGVPWWDYWLPKHAQMHGVSIEIFEGELFYHRQHEQSWSEEMWKQACKYLIAAGYDYDFEIEDDAIQVGVGAIKYRESLRGKKITC